MLNWPCMTIIWRELILVWHFLLKLITTIASNISSWLLDLAFEDYLFNATPNLCQQHIFEGKIQRSSNWIFIKLKEVVEDIENLGFVFDQVSSIIKGIKNVYSDDHCVYFMYHIQDNMKNKYQIVEILSFLKIAI